MNYISKKIFEEILLNNINIIARHLSKSTTISLQFILLLFNQCSFAIKSFLLKIKEKDKSLGLEWCAC